jgi:hypothetical protein
MRTIELKLAIVIPENFNEAELNEWLDFQLTGGSMPASSPLADTELKDLITMREDFGVIEYDVKLLE